MIGGGLGGFRRNGSAAVATPDGRVGVCDLARAIRVRDAGFEHHPLTPEIWSAAAAAEGLSHGSAARVIGAERGLRTVLPDIELVDHHWAHAFAAVAWTGVENATVLVADSGGDGSSVSLWNADAAGLTRVTSPEGENAPDDAASGPAELYAWFTGLAGMRPRFDESQIEAIARLAPDARLETLLDEDPRSWRLRPRAIERVRAAASPEALAPLAASFQREIAERLIAVVAPHRAEGRALIATGGLFFNTGLTTALAAGSGFADVSVPLNPGNAGLAPALALLAAGSRSGLAGRPFLGPGFSDHDIKSVLDNCKLRYDHLSERAIETRVIDTLARGALVGWFEGRLEAGPRALGHRSILADARAPYVLENLNRYLKQRESYRPFGLAVGEENVRDWFDGPPQSRAMQFEYALRPGTGLEACLPAGVRRVRLQTVPPSDTPLRRLIVGLGDRHPGVVPAIVHTSLNGFHEPLAASPRDALRIFYGTALDLLVIGGFVLEK